MNKIQNIDVRFSATSNFGKVKADLAALEAQAASLGAVFSKNAYAKPPELVNTTAWKNASRAVHEASNVYRAAASSSGLLTTQQIRATSETEKYTKSLQKQKLTFGDMRKHAGIMKQVYQDQLRYQRMTAQYWGTDMAGRAITDITIPKNVPRDLDNFAQRLHFAGQMAKSAGTQIVNMGKNMQWAGRQLTVGLTYPVALFGVAAGVMAYKVEDAFGSINKVYDVSAKSQQNEAARAAELGNLRVKSMEMAKAAAEEYGSSITDTLQIEQQLAATGMTMSNGLLQATKDVQRIAAIGDIDAGKAADMVVALNNAFKLNGKDLTNTLNYMNAAANATSLSIDDIAEATPRAASAMSALGVTAKQMTVLLVSMREAGVNAAEGANALKSATGTILKPSPAALEFIKEIAGGKVAKGVDQLAKSSGGNLYVAMEQLFKLTEKLDKTTRQQVIVSLFGKYQFNRVSAMLDNLGAAFEGTENQAKKAMDLMGRSAKENAEEAAKSLNAMTDTASGKFKRAFQTLKGELSEMGKPFLSIATWIANITTGALKFFNGMSDWKKKAVIGVAAVMALAGPAIMLGGLFMNLAGQFLTGTGRIMSGLGKLGGAFGLINKEEQAATLSAEAQNKAMQSQQSKTTTLAQEVQVLTAAYEKATAAARAYAESQGIAAASTAYKPSPAMLRTPSKGGFAAWSNSPLPKQDLVANQAALKAEQERLNLTRQEAQARQAATDKMRLFAASGALATASMVTMLSTSNETAQSIAKWALIGSMVVPSLAGASKWMGTVATNAGKAASNVLANARAAVAGQNAIGAMGTAMRATGAAAKSFGASLNAALGPVGWITLGLTAVVGTFMAIKSHEDKIKEEQKAVLDQQLKAMRTMQTSTSSIATNLGKAAGSYKQITGAGTGNTGVAGYNSELLQRYNYYKSDEGKGEIEAMQSDGGLVDTDRLMDIVREKFINLQVLGKDTAKQARTDIQAMLQAAGLGAAQAADMAQAAYKRLGDIAKVDWSRPIKDQVTAINNLMSSGPLSTAYMETTSGGPYWTTSEIDSGTVEKIKTQAEQSAAIFNEAVENAANPNDARKYINQYMQAALQQWNSGFDAIMKATGDGTDKARAVFEKFGIDSGKAFASAWENNDDFRKSLEDLIGSPSVWSSGEYIKAAIDSGKAFESAVIVPLAKNNMVLGDSIQTVNAALAEFESQNVGLTRNQAISNVLGSKQYQTFMRITAAIDHMNTHGMAGSTAMLNLQNQLNGNGKRLTATINGINKAYGLKQGRNAMQALRYLMNGVKADTDGAGKSVDDLHKKIDALPSSKTISIRLNQVGGVVQTAMSNVQNSMAESAMNQFNSNWDATMASAQAGWDKQMDTLQAHQQAAQEALQRRQQAAQDAFDRRWEKRKEAVTKEYQRRIDAINREIEAEQKADDVRQRLFEKEKARLERLAEMANTNIDFNVALDSGKLDEAAKILNNAGAKSGSQQMDDEQARAEARTQAKIDRLNKKNDRLEKQRDKELKQLEKLEDKMRKHLERVQQMQSKALEKHQAAEQKALEEQESAAMASLQKQRDYEEAMLEQRLTLFKAYTARNQRDLERWMKEVGLSYDDFGSDVKAKGEKWSKYFRTELSAQIRQAGVEVANDNIWENVGKAMGNKLLKGLGFDSLAEFNKFVRTGQRGGNGGTETHHSGGVVGEGGSGRGGIPNTYRGLHRTEKMVRAQKGEYIINKKDATRNLPLLERINRGEDLRDFRDGKARSGFGPGNHPREGFGAAPVDDSMGQHWTFYGGPAAIEQAVLGNELKWGAAQAFSNNYSVGLKKEQARQRREARRARRQNSSPGTKNVNIPEGTDPRGAAAIQWAADRIGTSGWHNMCLSFVRQAFGAPGGVYDAMTSWSQARNKYSTSGGIPAGVPVFWTTGSNGHVVISTGNGNAISTDHPVYDQPGKTTISSISSWLGASPAGWTADINGKSVYPALRTGGQLRADTLVRAHEGETMLTKPLTRKFKDGIAGNGGDSFSVTIDLRGAMIKEDVDIEKAVNHAIDARETKLGRRRVVK